MEEKESIRKKSRRNRRVLGRNQERRNTRYICKESRRNRRYICKESRRNRRYICKE